jgi:multicomponent Na+:H+ antiporter subunit C
VVIWLAILVGFLYAFGFYLMLRRSLIKVILGLALFAHGANLMILAAADARRAGDPSTGGVHLPIVHEGQQQLVEPFADPLPQALVLTAIVIGFGLQAFTLVLAKRAYGQLGVDDVDAMGASDRTDPEPGREDAI